MPFVEVVTFTVRADVDPARFATVDAAVGREYVSQQAGFVRRTTAHTGDAWVVIVTWADVQSAQASMDRYETAPAAAEQLSLMQDGTFSMTRFDVVTDI